MRSRSLLLVLFTIVLVILIGASTAMAKERVVQVLLPNCE
jgi:predicted S18 family serine protease